MFPGFPQSFADNIKPKFCTLKLSAEVCPISPEHPEPIASLPQWPPVTFTHLLSTPSESPSPVNSTSLIAFTLVHFSPLLMSSIQISIILLEYAPTSYLVFQPPGVLLSFNELLTLLPLLRPHYSKMQTQNALKDLGSQMDRMVIDRIVKEDHSTEVIIEQKLEGRNHLPPHIPNVCHSHSDLAIPRIGCAPSASGPLHILLLLPAMPHAVKNCEVPGILSSV